MTTLDKEKARQGENRKPMKYVLGISLALAIIALAVIGFSIG